MVLITLNVPTLLWSKKNPKNTFKTIVQFFKIHAYEINLKTNISNSNTRLLIEQFWISLFNKIESGTVKNLCQMEERYMTKR